MSDKTYEEFAILSSKIKELTEKKDAIRDLILAELVESGAQGAVTSFGKFTISKLKTWTYSPQVEKIAEDLKAKKAEEESTGDATFEEKPLLRFTPAKF